MVPNFRIKLHMKTIYVQFMYKKRQDRICFDFCSGFYDVNFLIYFCHNIISYDV